MQDADAARRLAILRGETPPPLPEPEPDIDPSDAKFVAARREKDGSAVDFAPRKRKRAGEDDTDFEMRIARERAEAGERVRGELAAGVARKKGEQTEIVDRDGHIDLVGAPPVTGKEKNPEYEREAAKKKRELEDQYTMRFSNAAGRGGFAAGDPWYAKPDSRTTTAAEATKEDIDSEIGMEAPTKNVWGNEDPRRKVREAQRLTSNDPLAMMKMGAKKVREVEKERKREADERERELQELRREDRRREKRRRREKHDGDVDRASDHHRHRSDRSEHSRRRRDDDGRREHRHRHRHKHDRERSRDTDTRREEGREHVRDMERERDRSGLDHSQRHR